MKNYPVPNVYSAEAEKLWDRETEKRGLWSQKFEANQLFSLDTLPQRYHYMHNTGSEKWKETLGFYPEDQ